MELLSLEADRHDLISFHGGFFSVLVELVYNVARKLMRKIPSSSISSPAKICLA